MSRVDDINTILDSLGEAGTYDQYEYALRDYYHREVIAVLADRAASGSAPPISTHQIFGKIAQPTTVTTDAFTSLPFIHDDGQLGLLDLTDPTFPTITVSGMYAVTATFCCLTASSADLQAYISLGVDANNYPLGYGTALMSTNNVSRTGGGTIIAQGAIAVTWGCEVGAQLQAALIHQIPTSADWYLEATVQKVS